MTTSSNKITIVPGRATIEMITALSFYHGKDIADITLQLVEEAIQTRSDLENIPDAVDEYVTGVLEQEFETAIENQEEEE
jgi:hypothetical protein